MTAPMAPSVSLAEAAALTGKSVSTIRRKKDELIALGAIVSDKGWQIPIPALVQMNLLDRVSAPDFDTPSDADSLLEPPMTPGGTTAEVTELKLRLAEAERRAAAAEAQAEERLGHIDDLRQSLRMLESGHPTTPNSPEQVPVTRGVARQEPKRRWWQRN